MIVRIERFSDIPFRYFRMGWLRGFERIASVDLSNRLDEICRYKEQPEHEKGILRNKKSQRIAKAAAATTTRRHRWSPRFKDKRGEKRKRGKAFAVHRGRSHAKNPSALQEGRGGVKTWGIEKGFQDSGKSVGKEWMNATYRSPLVLRHYSTV